MNIIQALDDPKVFGDFFRAGTWDVWRVFLAALFGLPMTDDQLATYRRFTGRSTPPTAPLHEAWLVIGRRGGKSFVLAVIAVFLACFRDWRPFLGPGEVGTVMIIAADRRQARVIMRYCTGLLEAVPMLAKLIEAQSRETIELKNRIVIEIHTASFRTTRGYTIVTALCDELAYWQSDETSAEPDVEVINALRPGMSTIPGRRAAVRVEPVCAQGRAVGCPPPALRPGRRRGAGLAGGHAVDEPECAAVLYRPAHGRRYAACHGRVWRPVPRRHRLLRQP